MNTNKKNKEWMRNKAQLKNPKIFSILVERNPNGSFRLIGGGNKVLVKKNQYSSEWVNVDTRDLCTELRNSEFHSY